MIKSVFFLALMVLVSGSGCGGSDADTGSATNEAATEETAELNAENQQVRDARKMVYSADAVYTRDDIPVRGNYLKLNFSGLTDEQVNRTVHRFRTEHSRCGGCEGLYIDEILAEKPACTITLEVAKNIIKEEMRRPESLQ